MDRPILKFFNFNGSRMSSLQRIRSMKAVFEALDSDIISIQEIDIKNSDRPQNNSLMHNNLPFTNFAKSD